MTETTDANVGKGATDPETQDLVPEATNTVEETLSDTNETDAAAQGMVPLAVACGESLTTSDGANVKKKTFESNAQRFETVCFSMPNI